MESILGWNTKEGNIFRGGSGSGINLSNIRGSIEQLSKGGLASGPVSFMRGADAWAGTIKSGGKTRRAAKMVVLDVDHPDIEDFIWCKAKEEDKAAALRDAGFDMSIDGEGFTSIQYQNANNSVRVSDDFMEAVAADDEWDLTARVDGSTDRRRCRPAKLMRPDRRGRLALRRPGRPVRHDDQPLAHLPGVGADQRLEPVLGVHARRRLGLQPGLDQPDEVPPRRRQLRHRASSSTRSTSSSSRRRSSSARRATRPRRSATTLAPSASSASATPTSARYLMSNGMPYDSDEGRDVAAAITALMTGRGYRKSAEVAAAIGPYDEYEKNREPHNNVMRMHRDAAYEISDEIHDPALLEAACRSWDEAVELGERHGYRNAQATVLAPTGTISFLMDCDTTGIEPDFSLVKYKELVGGGQMTIVNRSVDLALRTLGYNETQIGQIEAYVNEKGTIIGAPELDEGHLPVFDVAVGERAISHMGHIQMMSAAQPFLSGAISKTVNLPESATVADIAEAYTEGWKGGLKALAIYRDGSKTAQALRTDAQEEKGADEEPSREPVRKRMPRGARVAHPQVLDRRPGGLHHRRPATRTAPSARSSSPTSARRARPCAG